MIFKKDLKIGLVILIKEIIYFYKIIKGTNSAVVSCYDDYFPAIITWVQDSGFNYISLETGEKHKFRYQHHRLKNVFKCNFSEDDIDDYIRITLSKKAEENIIKISDIEEDLIFWIKKVILPIAI